MPNVYVTFPEIAQSVSRPIIYDIISQVEDIVKINKSTKVYFPGESQRMSQPGSTIDHAPFADPDRDPLFENDNYLFIEVDEDFETESITATNNTGACHNALFADDVLGVYLAPMYATAQVTIHFKYRAKSKTEALRWRDDIRMRVSQMRDINLHDITYHYPLPANLTKLLRYIHAAREGKHGYGDSFADYIKQYSVNRLTLIGDLANKEAKFAISETQMRIVGMYGFDAISDKPEYDQDIGTHTVSFDYKFTYERPLACHAKYPIMVHNQILPREVVEFVNQSYNLDNIPKTYSPMLKGLANFEAEYQIPKMTGCNTHISIPPYDDFTTKVKYSGTTAFTTVLCELDENDMMSLFNLRELGDYALDSDVLRFLADGEYYYLTKPYKSLINVSVYDSDNLIHYEKYEVDTDLNIRFKQPMSPRGCYRARLSLMTDLTSLMPGALERFAKHPAAFVALISAIDEALAQHPGFAILGSRTVLPLQAVVQAKLFLTGNLDELNKDPRSLGIYRSSSVSTTILPSGFTKENPSSSFVPYYGKVLATYQKKRVMSARVNADKIIKVIKPVGI